MAIYVGIDGGGSKTEAMAMDPEAGVAAAVRGPASNPNSVGWEEAVARVAALALQAVAALPGGPGPRPIRAVCAALAGVGTREDAARAATALSAALEQGVGSGADLGGRAGRGAADKMQVEVVPDALAALTAGTRGAPGVVLVAGTGSICIGEDGRGRTARSGGHGYLIGDEGSGFAIGREGLLAAIQSFEGRGPRTALWEVAAACFAVSHPRDLAARVYRSDHPVGTVATFARHVIEQDGVDPVATRILDHASAAHAALVSSVAAKLGMTRGGTVVLAGGLLANAEGLQRRIAERLREWRIVWPSLRPAAGAVLRAMRANQMSEVDRWEAIARTVTV